MSLQAAAVFPSTPGVFDPVAWWSRVEGARTAVIEASSGIRHSYRELDDDANRWSGRLATWGIGHGDRVAILAHNRYEFIPLLFACIRRGAILVPLNWRLSAPEVSRVLDNCMPMVVLGEDRTRALSEDVARLLTVETTPQWIDMDRPLASLSFDAQSRHSTTEGRASSIEDATMLLYTSGSTGAPKGVMIPHRQLLWNAIATTSAWQIHSSDVGPISTPFFHTGGWNVFTTPMLFVGATLVLIDGFDPDAYFGMLQQFGVTLAFGVPTQLAMVRETESWGRPLPALRTFLSGGAPCPQRIKDDVRAAGYRFREGYGLTECGPNCFATNGQTAIDKDGSVGWPMPFLEMRLRDEVGREVDCNGVGELELRGPQLFSGYYRAPERTAEVMTPDGWLRTGDLASRDDDGVYTIRGRRKEMFISGGENVYPGEVEAALLDCRGVREATVIGVPDARWGEVGCALIVRNSEMVDEVALLSDARVRLAAYKVPKRVCFVDAIPRLGSGKIDRRAAAALIEPQ